MKILNKAEVSKITSLCKTTIYRYTKAGTFPKPKQLTKNRIGWNESEVQAWIDSREVTASSSKNSAFEHK